MAGDTRRQSLYFPAPMLEEILEEAIRLDRSVSWVVQTAWQFGKARLAVLHSVSEEDATSYAAGNKERLKRFREKRRRIRERESE